MPCWWQEEDFGQDGEVDDDEDDDDDDDDDGESFFLFNDLNLVPLVCK